MSKDVKQVAAVRKHGKLRWWIARRPMFREAWQRKPNGLRHRVYTLLIHRYRWWDWGHRAMVLTGSDFGGNWSQPEAKTWWYKRVRGRRMWRTGYPRDRFEIVTDYVRFGELTKGLNEDQMYEWKAFAVNQDGELVLGHQYWGGNFYGLPRDEQELLNRYLRMVRRHDWFGLRSWLYSQGIHAAVHEKRPFRCNAQVPRGQGGYDHWYCQLKKRHEGMHRFHNYTWGEVDGEVIGAHLDDPKGTRA